MGVQKHLWWLGPDCSVELAFTRALNARELRLLVRYVELLGETLRSDDERASDPVVAPSKEAKPERWPAVAIAQAHRSLDAAAAERDRRRAEAATPVVPPPPPLDPVTPVVPPLLPELAEESDVALRPPLDPLPEPRAQVAEPFAERDTSVRRVGGQVVAPDGTIKGDCGSCGELALVLADDVKSPHRRCARCRPRSCPLCSEEIPLPPGGAIMVPRCCGCDWELGAGASETRAAE